MRRSAPIRRSRPRAKGGSRFPKRRDPAYMRWMLERLADGNPCDCGCGIRATHRAHLTAKGSGGFDRDNVVLLATACHAQQEKRTARFEVERGLASGFLDGKAQAWTARYDAEGPTDWPTP